MLPSDGVGSLWRRKTRLYRKTHLRQSLRTPFSSSPSEAKLVRVIIEPDCDAASRRAAKFAADLVRKKPDCVLGLATGSTPLGVYRELIRLHKEENLDFSHVTTFNL